MKSKAVYFLKDKKVEVREIEVPEPKDNEVQIKMVASGICMFDVWNYKNGTQDENSPPGHEGIGVVQKVGKDITGVKEGDIVACWEWSEYSNVPSHEIVKMTCKYEDIPYHMVEPASCAINAANAMNIYPGDEAVLFGVGYMGLLLLQVLKAYPLSKITVIDVNDHNLELAKNMGADEGINWSTTEGKERVEALENKKVELTFECSGNPVALDWSTKLLKNGGKLAIYAWHHDMRTVDTSAWHMKGLDVLNVAPSIAAHLKKYKAFDAADRLMTAGIIDQRKLITNVYKLEEAQKAMEETVQRANGFIKSVFVGE